MKDIFIYTRTIELLVTILVGTFICWLGYRLFFKGLSEKSDLSIEYDKFKLQLFSASPGIFFSLFGAIIIASSVWNVAKFQEEQTSSSGLKTKTIIEKGNATESNIQNFDDLRDTFNKAYALHIKGEYDEAKALYIKILKTVPVLNKTINNLADIYKEQGQIEQARILAQFCVSIYPEFEDGQKTLKEIMSK